MRTLIVDDSIASRAFMGMLLTQYGTCDDAADGLAAIDAFVMSVAEGTPYDLICLDVMMPKVDGLTVLKLIRNIESQRGLAENDRVKIILTTSLSDKDMVMSTYGIYCDAFAWKPIQIENFTQELARLDLIK